MSKPFPPPMRNGRRKLSVEVYFVLYLTAIILLLGTAPLSKERYDSELEEAIAQLINTDFGVEVEDIGLTIPFVPAGMEDDPSALNLMMDTVNVIRAHGSFSRVDFRIVSIEDTATGRALPIEKASLMRNGDSSVFFFWSQGEAKQTALYRICVEAEALPVIPASVSSPSLRRRIESIIAKRNAMRDTAIFSVNVLPITSPEYIIAAKRAPTMETGSNGPADSTIFSLSSQMLRQLAAFGQGFTISPRTPSLTSPPGKPWVQQLMVLGPEPKSLDLKLPPGVRITGYGNNYIEISGTAPARGETQVRVVAKTLGSSLQSEVLFLVTATTPSDPRGLPKTLYSGNSYPADFSTTGIDDDRISVTIIENGKPVETSKGASFNYVPSATEGTVQFIRYVDGKPFGEYTCSVSEYPLPVIGPPEENGPTVYVTTTSYGVIKGGPNVAVLRIERGNAHDPERVETNVDRETGRINVRWRIRRKNAEQPFEFTARVWDQRGSSYTNRLSYNGE